MSPLVNATSWRPPRRGAILSIGTERAVPGFPAEELWPGVHLHRPPETPDSSFWVEGAATWRGHVVGSSWTTPNELKRLPADEPLVDSWSAGAHGSACAWSIDRPSRTALVLPDFFGGTGFFIATLGRVKAVSCSLRQLELWAEAFGAPLTKSPLFQVERILLGNGGLATSSFLEVERVAAGSYIRLSNLKLGIRRYPLWTESLEGNIDPQQALELVKTDLLENVTAIAASNAEHKVAHLTGGADSRLVMAATVHSGVHQDFLFFTSGAKESTDRKIADGLSRAFNLTQTATSGTGVAPPRSARDRFITPMRVSGGITGSAPTGREKPRPIVEAGGGYGELLRSFFGKRLPTYHRNTDTRDLFESLWGRKPAPSAVTQSSFYHVLSKLATTLESYAEMGVPDHFILDYFYIAVRNRYHIGLNAALWSTVGTRLDPLYSPYLLALGRKQDPQNLHSAIPMFDLMDELIPGLRTFEFDTPRHDERATRLRPWKPTPFPTSRPLKQKRIPETRTPGPTIVEVTPDQRRRLVDRANTMQINYWQLAWLPTARQQLRRALNELSEVDVLQDFNREYLHELAFGEVRTKKQIRDVYSSLESLMWLNA